MVLLGNIHRQRGPPPETKGRPQTGLGKVEGDSAEIGFHAFATGASRTPSDDRNTPFRVDFQLGALQSSRTRCGTWTKRSKQGALFVSETWKTFSHTHDLVIFEAAQGAHKSRAWGRGGANLWELRPEYGRVPLRAGLVASRKVPGRDFSTSPK